MTTVVAQPRQLAPRQGWILPGLALAVYANAIAADHGLGRFRNEHLASTSLGSRASGSCGHAYSRVSATVSAPPGAASVG
jgi:hypothetical protein